MPDKAKIVVLSAPSGGGKSTICNNLIKRNRNFKISISATTRAPRSYETDGIHYFFFSKEEFFSKVKNGEFLETEEIHGNYYGTLKSAIDKLLYKGFTVLFDIGVHGALNVKKHYPEAVLIFIRPPSVEELKKRLKNRKSDDHSEIEKRLKRLPEEFELSAFFDYNVVNDNLEETVERIEDIIQSST